MEAANSAATPAGSPGGMASTTHPVFRTDFKSQITIHGEIDRRSLLRVDSAPSRSFAAATALHRHKGGRYDGNIRT